MIKFSHYFKSLSLPIKFRHYFKSLSLAIKFNHYFKLLSLASSCHLGLTIMFNDVKWTCEIEFKKKN
jgi:hypothetical protein